MRVLEDELCRVYRMEILTTHVAQLARFDQMSDQARYGENDAKDSCRDVCPSEERLLASNP